MESKDSQKTPHILIHGAKNSAMPLLCTTLLSKKIYKITNIPEILDVKIILELIKQLNVSITQIEKNTVIVDTTKSKLPEKLNYEFHCRGTLYLIGALLHLTEKEFCFSLGNGCDISDEARKINFHLDLIKLTGKKVEIKGNDKLIVFGKDNGKDIIYEFEKKSVSGTINGMLILTSRSAKGLLKNYAKDPYVFEVASLLKKLGFCIFMGENSIKINYEKEKNEKSLENLKNHREVNTNNSKEFSNDVINVHVHPDPIEALSYIIFAAVNLTPHSVTPFTIGPLIKQELGEAVAILENCGIYLIETKLKNNFLVAVKNLSKFDISTDYFPGLYTDAQPFFCLLGLFIDSFSQNNSEVKIKISTITETIWNNRTSYISEINKLGFNIKKQNNQKIIIDHEENNFEKVIGKFLSNSNELDKNNELEPLILPDLRAGMMILMLSKLLKSKNKIINLFYVERGYEDFDNNLNTILENSYKFSSDSNRKNTIKIKFDYPTDILTNISIGGKCKFFAEANSEEEIIFLVGFSNLIDYKFRIIGGGNNIFFPENLDYFIIKNKNSEVFIENPIQLTNITNCEDSIRKNRKNYDNSDNNNNNDKALTTENSIIQVSSGFNLKDLVEFCKTNNFDISQLAGIPGTVGGSVYGNAGAYGFEMADLITKIKVLRKSTVNNNFEIIEISKSEMKFEYRSSAMKKQFLLNEDVILSVKLDLSNYFRNSRPEIQNNIDKILKIRLEKFGRLGPNIGSVFINPTVNNQKLFMWKLIDNFELRGKVVKNIKFYEINPNILTNENKNASSNDLIEVISMIKNLVKKNNGIYIETEIELIK